jgi:hypothetical protein
MNAEQALNILIQASQLAAMPAQAHAQCQQAAQVLHEAIKPKPESKDDDIS